MFELLEYLEQKIVDINSEWLPGDETGASLSYDIIDDNSIHLDYGWTSYEEGESNEVDILFSDKIIVNKIMSGHSVYGGDYENNDNFEFNNITELINWLKEE